MTKQGADMPDSDSESRDLGDDVLIEILSRLPAKSLFSFKCVSKAWQSFISRLSPERRLQLSLAGFYCHVQGFDRNDSKLKGYRYMSLTTPNNLPTDNVDVASLDFLPCSSNFRIINSCNGLLLCLTGKPKNSTPYYVCNPLTRTWTALPKPPSGYQQAGATLDFDPMISSSFHTVVLTKSTGRWPNQYIALAVFPSDIGQSWVEYKLSLPSIGNDYISLSSIIYMNGVLYAIQSGNTSHFLMRICINESTNQSIKLPHADQNIIFAVSAALVRVQSCVHYITHNASVLHIWKLAEDLETEWILVGEANMEGAENEAFQHYNNFGPQRSYKLLPLAFYPEQDMVLLRLEWKIYAYHVGKDKLEEICSLVAGDRHRSNYNPYNLYSRCNDSVYPYIPCSNRLVERRAYN